MTFTISADDSILANDLTLAGMPALAITGNRVRFTNTESGRVIADTIQDSAIVITGSGTTIVNQAGGIIRSADGFFREDAPTILGSAFADRIENAGTILGLVSLGGGNDVFVDTVIGSNANIPEVRGGDGDDDYILQANPARTRLAYFNGGAGVDRLIVEGPDGNISSTILTSVEIMILRTNGFIEGMSGLQRIEVDFRPAGRNFDALRFMNSPDAAVVILDDNVQPTASLSIYDRSLIGSVTGSAISDRVSIANDTILSGAIDLGAGDDQLSIGTSQFSNPVLERLGTTIAGGSGRDALNLQSRAGAAFDAGNVTGFEVLNIFGSFPAIGPEQIVRNISGFDQVILFQGANAALEAAALPTVVVDLYGPARLAIDASSVIGGARVLVFGAGNNAVADDTKSVTITVQGRVLGTLQFSVGDDRLSGELAQSALVASGGAGNDDLVGGAFADRFEGGFGADTLVGGGGDDSLDGGSANDRLDGGDGDDVLEGGDGSDQLFGEAGNDRITGAAGDDFLYGDNNFAFLPLPPGADLLAGGSGNDLIYGGWDNDTLSGDDGNDLLYGQAGDDILIGGAGNDRLDDSEGTNRFDGGAGDDVFVISRQADLVFESVGGGTDTVIAPVGHYLFANVENLVLAEGGDAFGVGNELDNTLIGNQGRNLLIGGDGNDTIDAGFGNDALFGQDGDDVLVGDAGIDYLVGGNGNDLINGGDDADALYGEEGDDVIIGGFGFVTDILVGGAGNDTLYGDFGGLGDYDLMDGGDGDDIYWVDTPADLTFEAAGGGVDTVRAGIDGAGYYLYPNVENLMLEGYTPFGVGNDLDNILTGSFASNYLLGGAGNDTLNGKADNDVLFGETGADLFVFERGTGGDVIGDFAPGTDRIQLTGLGFTSFAQLSANFVEVAGTTAIDLGQGDFIVINGITNAALSAADFVLG